MLEKRFSYNNKERIVIVLNETEEKIGGLEVDEETLEKLKKCYKCFDKSKIESQTVKPKIRADLQVNI